MIFRLRPLTADEGRLRQQTHGVFTPAAEFIRPDTGTEVTDCTRQKLIGLLAIFLPDVGLAERQAVVRTSANTY